MRRRLRICVASELLADPAGLPRAASELAVALAAAGHTVHAVTRQVGVELPGVDVRAVVDPPLLGPLGAETGIDILTRAAAAHQAVAELHESEGVDAVVAPLGSGFGAVAALDGRFPTALTCMTTTQTIRDLRPGGEASDWELRAIAVERATMRRARFLHGLTRAGLDRALADYPGQVPLEVGIVGRGLADRCGRGAAGSGGGPSSEQVRILSVGRIERRKGPDVLLDAAARLRELGADFDLTLIGAERRDALGASGLSLREEFERDADRWMADRVHFAGAVEEDELDRQYRAAGIVCAPTRYESHGVVLVEAMMYGRPIVTTRAGGVPEVVEEGGNALLVEPDDPEALAAALRSLIHDPGLRRRMGERSRELYEERFTAEVAAERMAEFLERVAERHEAERREAERAAARATAVGGADPLADPADRLAADLAALVAEAFDADAATARATAAELLDPPAAAWRAAALELDRQRAAWQARAQAAEQRLAPPGSSSPAC